jgi:hypothetical protein
LVFFCRHFDQIGHPDRHFQLTSSDLVLLNPNTRTLPVFRTKVDARLTKEIYGRVPVLESESLQINPWGIRFSTMFHMSNDSGLFAESPQAGYLPLYEAKMVWHYDHRFASLIGQEHGIGRLSRKYEGWYSANYTDAADIPVPRYWVAEGEVGTRLQGWKHRWLLCFRDVTNAVVERTAIFAVIPYAAVGNNAPLLFMNVEGMAVRTCLLADLSSLVYDYITRQKIAGTHMNFFFVRQLPSLPPTAYGHYDFRFINPRVLELVYTAWDIKAFADDIWSEADEDLRTLLRKQWAANEMATGGHAWDPPAWAEIAEDGIPLPPFKWDDERRAYLRADLDAYYARLYGLTRDELRYILDPADVYGPDFPGETFRVLKEKEIKQLGEYRTQRLVLAAWDRLERELGPVVVRNYREEMPAEGRSQKAEVRSQRSEQDATRPKAIPVAKAAPVARPEQPVAQTSSQRGSSTPIPVMAAPQGSYSDKLARIMALKRQATPEAIGEMVAALGDADERIRWLAGSALASLKDARVVEAVRVFGEGTESVEGREAAGKLLMQLDRR